jgi:hypothetical protein
MAGTCECGNEPSGSIKCGESLDLTRHVRNYIWVNYTFIGISTEMAAGLYIGASDRGLVPTQSILSSRLLTHREERRCREEVFGLPSAKG